MRTFEAVRGRLTYANVIATLALFFALGGGVAVAAPKFIEQGSPAGGDLTGTYPNPSIAANAVTGGKVLNNSLTGDDIAESTLGKVPSAAVADSAASAGDADTLDGIDSTGFLGATAKAADSDLLDGNDSSAFLGASAKAADSDKLDGLDSSSFVAGVHTVTGNSVDIDLFHGGTSSASCPSGEKALSGGYSLLTINSEGDPFDPQAGLSGFYVISIGPTSAGDGWTVTGQNPVENVLDPTDFFTIRLTVTAVCAKTG